MLILRFLYDFLFRCLQNNIAELLICIPAYVEELKKQGNATYVFYLSLDLKTLGNLQFIEKTSTVNSIPLIVKNFVKKKANAIDVTFY